MWWAPQKFLTGGGISTLGAAAADVTDEKARGGVTMELFFATKLVAVVVARRRATFVKVEVAARLNMLLLNAFLQDVVQFVVVLFLCWHPNSAML